VCFPHVGGGASFFRSWHDGVPPGVELLAVQYPGREDRTRDAPIEDMDRMADAIAGVLAGSLDEPLVLFGHSMGAAVAYEVALRLGPRTGHALRGIVLSAQPSPRHFVPNGLHLLDDDALWADTQRFNGFGGPHRSNPTLRRLMVPVLRSDYRLIETYRPRLDAAVDCPVVACMGDADPHVTLESIRGWGEMTRHGFDVRVFPGGDHFYLRLDAHRDELLAIALRALGE
jgi:pyochelin biosynthesis protein PchC